MKIYEKIRNTLKNHVFEPLGSDVTIRKVTYTLNDRDERVGETTASESVVRGVRYNQAVSFFQESFGTIKADDSTMVLPSEADVSYSDTIIVDGESYSVRTVDVVPNSENRVAVIVGLSKSF